MKNFLCLLCLLFVFSNAQAKRYQYTIHPGDILEISVWNEEALQRELRVLPDGSISFPLSGIINVKGKTLKEVQNKLTERLSIYIPEAEVNVSVKSSEGNSVYVIGQVKKPGQVVMFQPMDVMQLLSIAGGLTPFAKENDILILRRQNNESEAIEFRYSDIEEGDGLNNNFLLETGDVIVVP